jgi:A/G-specific adenine glycosylase
MADPLIGPMLAPADVAWLRRQVRRWFSIHGRRFPWRETTDPYAILVAEVLLQRTRADLVPAVFERFIERYPTVQALAGAEESEVVELLRPLGFLHRSARLPATARELCGQNGGVVPDDVDALAGLPGVGRYVANAVAVLAFSRRAPLLDPNVLRVLGRCFDVRSERARPRDDETLWRLVEQLVPRRNPRPTALGLVDIGAVVCRNRQPRCDACPLKKRCRAYRSGAVMTCG